MPQPAPTREDAPITTAKQPMIPKSVWDRAFAQAIAAVNEVIAEREQEKADFAVRRGKRVATGAAVYFDDRIASMVSVRTTLIGARTSILG